jgi:hypothetical protein
MRLFRVGAWLVAVPAVIMTAARLTRLGYENVEATVNAGKVSSSWIYDVLPRLDVGLFLLVVIGSGLLAYSSAGWARRLFALAALSFAVPSFVELFDFLGIRYVDDAAELQLIRTVEVLGIAALAGGSIFRGAGKRLAWSLISLTVLTALLTYFGAPHRTWMTLGTLLPMMTYTALDLLGLFPAIAQRGVPRVAVVRRNADWGAISVNAAFIAAGVIVLWTGIERLRALNTPYVLYSMMIAFAVLLAGVLGWWRLRGRFVSVPIVVAIVIAGYAGGSTAIQAAIVPIDEIALSPRQLAGAQVSLPVGIDELYAYRDVGVLGTRTNDIDLDSLNVWWGFGEHQEFSGTPIHKWKQTSNAVEVEMALYSAERKYVAALAWACPSTTWFRIRIATWTKDRRHFSRLVERIASSIICGPSDPGLPALVIPFESAGFASAKSSTPRIAEYTGPRGAVVAIAWTKDWLLSQTLQKDPKAIFDWLGFEDPPDISRGFVGIDGDQRELGEVIDEGQRKLVSAWHCTRLNIDVAVAFEGPVSSWSHDAVIDLLRNVHCP